MKLLTCVWILALLVSYAYCQAAGNTDQQRTEATENARQTTAALYDLIRGIAFPQSPTLDTQATNQNNRFILLMPGKVLNYFDYYPGREYTKFIQVQLIARKHGCGFNTRASWLNLSHIANLNHMICAQCMHE